MFFFSLSIVPVFYFVKHYVFCFYNYNHQRFFLISKIMNSHSNFLHFFFCYFFILHVFLYHFTLHFHNKAIYIFCINKICFSKTSTQSYYFLPLFVIKLFLLSFNVLFSKYSFMFFKNKKIEQIIYTSALSSKPQLIHLNCSKFCGGFLTHYKYSSIL